MNRCPTGASTGPARLPSPCFAVILCLLAPLAGCAPLGVSLYYDKADLPEARIVRNVRYLEAPGADPDLNRLDLFLPLDPKARDWPTLVFVHGGSWSEGDKDLDVAGADVYRNIGRFFASQGIGAAVISYRLLPEVDWKTQVRDVARATAWVHAHVRRYHGDPDAIFLSGHSAGAQLAARVALDPAPLKAGGVSPRSLCGVIPISGIGFDFENEETYQFGKDQGAIRTAFGRDDLSREMRKELSLIRFVEKGSPPFLILYAAEDPDEIKHASQRLEKAFKAVGARSQLYQVADVSHKTMVLALSHPDEMPASLMITFIRTSPCGRARR